ncbi:MAG: peptidoglycan/xylan/chitin deacetylase (PgdA/CDA1 family) [Bacteroidia bacterium]|jgi:peptidoglycan/xylan/chitin deacetylase (PgdA/CDA1 family)
MITKKLIQRLKWTAGDAAFSLGVSSLSTSGKGCRVLIYHGIDLDGRTDFNTRFISADYFEKQIAYFSKHFNVVSLDDIYANRVSQNKLNVAITFDDGYLNNLKYAVPVLEKHQVPATFFVTGIRDLGTDILWPDFVDMATTKCNKPIEIRGQVFRKNRNGELTFQGKTLKHICKSQDWNYKLDMMEALKPWDSFRKDPALADYWKQMTSDEIKKLASSSFVSIGSHGYFHNNLGDINHESACQELEQSKLFLENIIQKEVRSIAYPDGSYTRELVDAALLVGYSQQLAVDYVFEQDKLDPRILDRFGINPFISWNNQLNCIVKNSYW